MFKILKNIFSTERNKTAEKPSQVTGNLGSCDETSDPKKEMLRLIGRLENTKKELEEKTSYLARAQDATLNMLEDLQETKIDLEKTNKDLSTAKTELEEFSRDLENKIKASTYELSVFYDISNSISFTLDEAKVIKLLIEALFKIVKYEVCAVLLFNENRADVTIKPAYSKSAVFIDKVKENIIEAATIMSGENIRDRIRNVVLLPSELPERSREEKTPDEVFSFFNAPFIVRGKFIGMINVSSPLKKAFDEEAEKLVYTLANQASNALERMRAVTTAEKSKMESMVESMGEGLIMLDENGRVLVVNPKAKEILGIENVGSAAEDLLIEKFKFLGVDAARIECIKKEQPISKEVGIHRGKELIYKLDMYPVKDPTSKKTDIVVIFRDITREKEIDKMKTEFISTVSHELRTPLAITKEGISIILDEIAGAINERQKKILGMSKDNIDRLARLINDLLDISKIEAKRVQLKKTLVCLNDLVKKIANSFEAKVKDKGLKLKLDIPEEDAVIYVDQDHITQVFTNFLANAVKFTEKGLVGVRCVKKDGSVECAVFDTGPGIAKSDVPRLFDKFQQFGRKAGGGEKGTGLGLSIAKGIVEMHGGSVWVESEPGVGSTFYFSLPEYKEEEHVYEMFEEKLQKASEEGHPFALLIISVKSALKKGLDISVADFEKIIEQVIVLLRKHVGADVSVVGRRGKELLIGLSQAGPEEAKVLVEKLITDIIDLQFGFKLVLQVGISSYPRNGRLVAELIEFAHSTARTIRIPLRKILIVDDDKHFVEIATEWLEGRGLKVCTAENGDAGFKIAAEGDADLIILDMRLPGMSGYEVLGHLKADKRTEDIPLIFTSAYEIDKRMLYALASSAIPVFPKADGADKLLKLIESYGTAVG